MSSKPQHSLRVRLALVLGVGLAVLLLGVGFVLAKQLRRQLAASFDDTLATQARALAALIEQERGHIEFDYSPGTFPEYVRDNDPHYFQVKLGNGDAQFRSKFLTQALPAHAQAKGVPAFRDTVLPTGQAGRMVQLTFTPNHSIPDLGDKDEDSTGTTGTTSEDGSHPVPDVVLIVARERESLDQLVGQMIRTIAWIGLVSMLLAGLLLWRALAHGLRPLDDVVAQVSNVRADTLDLPLDVKSAPRELEPVVAQLNALLARLDDSLQRERRFTGNVAHELRTPIAELRTLSTVASRWPRDQLSTERFYEDVHAITGSMESMVGDLLLLARCHAGMEVANVEPMALRDAVETTWIKVASTRGAAVSRLRLEIDPQRLVECDASKFGMIMVNLFDNALSYAPSDALVLCTAIDVAGTVALTVSNPAEALSETQIAHIEEPFSRGDSARTGDEHAGLGLSLVSSLAQILRLRVNYSQTPDGVFTARLGGLRVADARAAGVSLPSKKVSP